MKKFKLPKIHFPCSSFVEIKQLKKLPQDMVLRVDASTLCARTHSLKHVDLSYKPERFREIYDALEHILFSKLDKKDYEEGVSGIFPVKTNPYDIFYCDECRMCVSDIQLFFGDDIPLTALKLLPEHARIAYEREEKKKFQQNFISLGTVKELTDKLSRNGNKCKVFFDKNNDKLVICNADEKPWNN